MSGKNMPATRVQCQNRLAAYINGTSAPDPQRFGYLTPELAKSVLDLTIETYKNPGTKPADWMSDHLKKAVQDQIGKTVTVGTGLVYYDLRAPAMNLFPTVTPLRNSIPRMQRQFPGDALHYKAVTATTGSGFPYMGWVPEGQRAASMSYTTTTITLPYVTLGEEDSISEEARFAAEGFEDEDALVQLRLLLRMFVKEETGILGGNATLALGTPTTPTLAAGGSGNTLAAATYSVIVVALTQEGVLNSSLANGVATTLAITGNDGQSYTLFGGSSNKSANVTQAVTSGQALSGSTPVVSGAVAYAWYIGAAGAETLQQITTINSFNQTTPLAGSRQAATAVTADHSNNGSLLSTTLAFDGLLTVAYKNAALATPNAYLSSMATGTSGTGTGLTSSGHGSINEIDTMFLTMWNRYLITPTVLYVNAQELNNLSTKVLNGTSAPLLRYTSDVGGAAEYKLTANGVIAFYFNPFTADGGVKIPIKIHPTLAAGTLFGFAQTLPPWYISNAVPEVAVVQTRQDYYAEVWPKTTRAQFYGIYAQEALAVFAPFSMGIINNIGNA